MPRARRSSAAPIPESWSSCGELIAPPHRITSPARAVVDRAAAGRVLDADRPLPSNRIRETKARVRTSRFGPAHDRVEVRPRGRQPAAAVDVPVERAKPSCR